VGVGERNVRRGTRWNMRYESGGGAKWCGGLARNRVYARSHVVADTQAPNAVSA